MTIVGDLGDMPDDPAFSRLRLDSPDVLDIRMGCDKAQEVLELLCEFAESKTKDERTLYRFRLVCDEFLVNVFTYAYGTGCGPVYAAADSRDGLKIIIRDKGMPFDPLNAPEPDTESPLEERPVGGYGIMLSKQFSKELRYTRIEGWNILEADL